MNNISDQDLIASIVEGIQERKGHEISIIDLTSLHVNNALYFIIAQGNTPTQVSAIADSVREIAQEKTGLKPINYTGYTNSTWIAIDYGSIMVHIFVPDARKFYDIEQLWADGVITNIPDVD